MKKLLIILLLFSTTQAATKKGLKKELEDCRSLNLKLIEAANSSECVNVVYSEALTKKDVKIARIKAKEVIKTTNSNNKVEIKTDWFKNLMNNITKVVALLTLVGTAGVGAFLKTIFDKFIK